MHPEYERLPRDEVIKAVERRNPQANAHAPSPINANCHVECTSIQPN